MKPEFVAHKQDIKDNMIKENSFINSVKEKQGEISPSQEWSFRQAFRRMTNAEKKRHDSDYVKEKNKLRFSEWFELIGENIHEGNYWFEENNTPPILSSKHDGLRSKLDDDEYRKYIGLKPLSKNDKKKIKRRFKKNTDFSYPV